MDRTIIIEILLIYEAYDYFSFFGVKFALFLILIFRGPSHLMPMLLPIMIIPIQLARYTFTSFLIQEFKSLESLAYSGI